MTLFFRGQEGDDSLFPLFTGKYRNAGIHSTKLFFISQPLLSPFAAAKIAIFTGMRKNKYGVAIIFALKLLTTSGKKRDKKTDEKIWGKTIKIFLCPIGAKTALRPCPSPWSGPVI